MGRRQVSLSWSGSGDMCGFNLRKLLNSPVLECALSCVYIALQLKRKENEKLFGFYSNQPRFKIMAQLIPHKAALSGSRPHSQRPLTNLEHGLQPAGPPCEGCLGHFSEVRLSGQHAKA